jgi:hypothetical protein
MAGTFPGSWQETCIATILKAGGTPRNFMAITETVDISEPDYPWESVPNIAGGRIPKQSSQEDGEITLELYPISIDSTGSGLTISSIDGNTTTITVDTSTNHGLKVGDIVVITGTTNYNGTFAVATITDANTFTITSPDHNFASEATGTATPGYSNTGLQQEFVGGTVDSSQPLIIDTSWTAGVDKSRDTFLVALMWTDDDEVWTSIGATTGTDKVAKRFYAKLSRLVSHKSAFTEGILKTTVTFKFPAMNPSGSTIPWAWASTNDTAASALPALTYTSATDL